MNFEGVNLLAFLVSILLAMGFHEAMHAFTSHWLGDTTARDAGRLTLNPLKHIDALTTVLLPVVLVMLHLPPFFVAKPVPFNPDRLKYDEFGAALVALAGPFTNLALAGVSAFILHNLSPDLFHSLGRWLFIFIQVNIGFFVFNMIPFPPLDGSRLLYALAPEPVQKVMQQIESLGFMAILAFFFIFFQFLSPVIININEKLLNFLL